MKKITTILIACTLTTVMAVTPDFSKIYPLKAKAYSCMSKTRSDYADNNWHETAKTENIYTGELLTRSNNYANGGTEWNLADYSTYQYNADNMLLHKDYFNSDGTNNRKEENSWSHAASGDYTQTTQFFSYNSNESTWINRGQIVGNYSSSNKLQTLKGDIKQDFFENVLIYIKKDVEYTYTSGLLTRTQSACGIAYGDSSEIQNFIEVREFSYLNNLPHTAVTKLGITGVDFIDIQWDTLSFSGNSMTRVTRKIEDDSSKAETTTRLTAQLNNTHQQFCDEFQMELPVATAEIYEKLVENNWIYDYKNNYTFAQTSISETKNKELKLNAYPNPFNPSTTISFQLPIQEQIKLSIYNAKGELVKNLMNGMQNAGSHSVNFDGTGLNSGVYFYKLESGNQVVVNKLLMVK